MAASAPKAAEGRLHVLPAQPGWMPTIFNPGKRAIEIRAGRVDFVAGEVEIRSLAIGGKTRGACAIERDFREMARPRVHAGAETMVQGQPPEEAAPHGDAASGRR